MNLFGAPGGQQGGGGLFGAPAATTTTTTGLFGGGGGAAAQPNQLFGGAVGLQQKPGLFGAPAQIPVANGGFFGINQQPQQQQPQQQTGMFGQPQQQQQQQQQQPQQQQQQQPQQQQQAPLQGQVIFSVNSDVWRDTLNAYSKLSTVKREQILIERDIGVSDNNNKYAHKLVTQLPLPYLNAVQQINQQICDSETSIASLVKAQQTLQQQIQETRKTIQGSSLLLKQTAQQVKDIQDTVNELISEQQEQKQYISNFFYAFTNSLENRQIPRVVLPLPFVVKAQEKFAAKMDRLQRQIDEIDELLQVEITKRSEEEELAQVFIIVEQLFKYFNNVTALVYDFHKHYESFRMRIVHLQDQKEFGFASDLNETTKHAIHSENKHFKHLSYISDELEKQILKHEETIHIKPLKKDSHA